MKITFMLFLFSVLSYKTNAQMKAETIPVFIGYMGHTLLNPGIKIRNGEIYKVKKVVYKSTNWNLHQN